MKKLLMLIAVTMASMMAFSAAPTKGLIAYYPFDGDAKDKSGNHNDGVMIGTRPTADRKGRLGSAMLFGEGKYITVPSSKSLNSPTEQITIAAWVRVGEWFKNRWGTEFNIVGKGETIDKMAYHFEFYSNNNKVCTGGLSVSDIGGIECGYIRGEWHHVVLSSDGKIVRVYIDGAIVGAGTAGDRLERFGSTGSLYIGRLPPGRGDRDWWFLGAMDELRIYNRALSDDEIKAVYEADPPTKTNTMETKGWQVTTFDRTVRSIGDAEATVQSDMGMMAQGDYSVLAFSNCGNSPYPEQHFAFPGKNGCLVMQSKGTVRIPSAGMWTFGIGCDDGAKIRIKGKDFVDVIVAGCALNQRFPVNIPVAGDYEIEVVFFDFMKGCDFSLSAAKGNWATFDKSEFKLVGDPECEIKMVAPKEVASGSACPDCKGEKVKLIKCKKCNGKGTITKSRKLSGGGTVKEGVKCPACSSVSTPEKGKGSGRVKKVCPTCNGEGTVER